MRRLPRIALVVAAWPTVWPGLSVVMPGRNADMAAFGLMADMAKAQRPGGLPTLAESLRRTRPAALLAGRLGDTNGLDMGGARFVARIPFMLLLALAMTGGHMVRHVLPGSRHHWRKPLRFGLRRGPANRLRAGDCRWGRARTVGVSGPASLAYETTPALAPLAFASLLLFAAAAPLAHRLIALGTQPGTLAWLCRVHCGWPPCWAAAQQRFSCWTHHQPMRSRARANAAMALYWWLLPALCWCSAQGWTCFDGS